MKLSICCNSQSELDQARWLLAAIQTLPRRAKAKALQPELLELNLALGEDITQAEGEAILARYKQLSIS